MRKKTVLYVLDIDFLTLVCSEAADEFAPSHNLRERRGEGKIMKEKKNPRKKLRRIPLSRL